MPGNWLKNAVKKLVSKVKDSDVAERSQATNNTRYEDLSSYVLVSTDRAQEVQEGNDITQDTAAANTQDFENVHSKGVPSSACHQKRLQNTPESTVVPPTVTSNKMDRDFSVSDLVPDHFGVNDNSCTSLLNVLHDSAIEQSVQDKHLDSLKDGMCHKDDNLQDNELRPRNLNGGSFVNVADPFRESAHVHAPLNFETRDKMKATGAVPKVPLVENKKLKDKNLIDKSLNDPYTLRAYLISRRQANLSDDRLNIQVDAPALSYDKTASSSEIPVNLNKENGTIVAFEKKSDGQFGQNDTPGEEQKEDKDEIKEEDAPVEEQKEDKEEIKEDSKLENAIRLCAERLLVPTRTDLDREADVTTVQTGGNIDTGKLTGETGLPDVKQLLTSAQLQIVNLQSHKVSAERRNHAPFDNTSRPAQPNRKDKACNQPMKKMSGEEPSSREKPIQHQKPNGRSGSTQGGNTTSKGRQRSRTSSSSSTDTVKNPEYKSTGKKPSEKTVDKKRDVPQRKNRVKSHDVEGKTSKMSKTQRRPMLRENAAKSLPVGNQIANAIEKKTNETDTARCSAEESVFKIERQNCERKRSKEGHDGKTLPVTKVSREATQLKKSEGARETLRSARERIKRNKENKPKICNKENQGTAKRVNVIFSDEPTMEKGVIEDYLKNLLPTKMSFTLIDAKSTNLKTCFVIVEFPSTNQARKAVTSLLKTSSRTKVKAHMVEKEVALQRDEANKFLNEQKDEVLNKGNALIEKHQKKINEMQKELDKLKVTKHIPLHMYEKIRIEREAVESKLEELKNQKEEFTIYHRRILDRIQPLEKHNKPKDKVNKLRLEFGQECLKLTSALPIYARRRHIIELVNGNPVSVILGETGSGKSTQLVQFIHQAQSLGLAELASKMIVCTQPRKVAAQSLAKHVADEMGTNCGGIVGYKTGSQSNTSSKTNIVFTTDHTLLNECLKDPTLQKYSCIIIDEAHERSIYTDLLLGMIKKCLAVRNDLRVIVTSATIDPQVFVKYFGGAPVLRVSGRMFPVDVVYNHPADPVKEDYLQESVEKVREIHQQEPEGDILVFLTSPLETQKACERVGATNNLVCLPLHGQLQAQEQQAVFEPVPLGKRKVVFATNSAETSITIPGIKYVVDTGRVKEKIFDPKKNMSALVVKSISKSSAEQRKGRAGRLSSGKCYRLYTDEDFNAMEPISLPEILRVHLGQALLKLMEIGIADPLSFDFVQSPSKDALQSAMKILTDLKAVNDLGITDLGKRMALLPVEPRMAKLIFDAIAQGCGLEGIAIAVLSTISGVFYRMGTEEDKKQADYFKTKFCQAEGDIHTFLHVYKEWNSVPEKQKSAWCFKNYINGKSIRACRETVHEIRKILSKDLGINVQYQFTEESKCSILSTILLDCFRSNLGYFTGHSKSGYFVVNDDDERFLQIHPSSSLSYLASTPKWVVYLDVLKTSNDYMLNTVTVDDCEIQRKIDAGDFRIDQGRLDRVTLVECVVAEVGSSLMSSLIGPRFQNLKSMEKELNEAYNRPVVLDVHRERCQMKAFTIPVLFDEIKSYFYQRTAPERFKLKREIIQIPVTYNSNTRAVIEAGGQCSNVLMPNETRTLLLRNVPDGWTEYHVKLELQGYGKVTHVEPYTQRGYGANRNWGKITFHDATSTRIALEEYRGDMLLVPDGISKAAQFKNEFKVRIQWCRRPTRGFAFVKPRDPEDVMILSGNRKVIRGFIASIRIAKDDPTKLFITGLSKDTTEDDVRNALSPNIPIETVVMPRQKVGETQPEKLQALTGQMNMKIMEFAERDEFSVKILQPKAGTYDFFGYIIFSNPETGVVAIDRLNGSVFDMQKLSVCAELKTSLHVQQNIYRALKLQLDATIEQLKRNNRSARINIRQLRSGHFAINLEADEVDAMSRIRNILQEMISGHRIECSTKEEEQALFSHAGRDLLTLLQKQRALFIRVDTRLRTVTVYGDRDDVEEAQETVKTFLNRFRDLKSREIQLRGDGRPPGLMKHLLLEHGLEMESLRRESGMEMLTLILQKHLLKATGSADALEKLVETIAAATKKLQENAMVSLPDDIDCTVCLCPINGSVYRLEFCGHPYCADCILGLIKSGITSKQYPILCAEEGCQDPLVLKDFNNWLGPEQRQELVKSSIDSFLGRNSKMFKFCDSPDCPVLYRIGYNEGAPYQCSGCGVTICTRCHVQYHYGLTCAMYRSKLKNPDSELEKWIKEDPENRRLCPGPGCKAHIEKNGGCMRVHCIKCNTYICWKCMKTFKCGDAAYSHLAKDCGGIFEGDDD